MTTTTRTTSTGHTLTHSTANPLWLRIEGDADTMDSIPDTEVHEMACWMGMEWNGEAIDETTLLLAPIRGTRYAQDGTTYICAGNQGTTKGVARDAAEKMLRTGETLGDRMSRVDGCCTWTVVRAPMNKPSQYVALVYLGDLLHAVGPFASAVEAGEEGGKVAKGVDLFAPVGSQSFATVRVMSMFANLSAMIPG
jgi:hypothetical protein